jgi:predicted dienelactone hydrolase
MTSLVSVKSKAADLPKPHISTEPIWNHLATKVAGRSLENAIYADNHLSPVPTPSAFTERNFVHFRVSLNTPRCLKTDSSIDVEIFATAPGDRKPPVLIFSHGYGAHPSKYRPFLTELANHGFTVLSLTHQSSLGEIPELPLKEENAKLEQLAEVMENNIQYVLGMVRQGALKDLGDTNRIV